ncbi:hypothetical protein Plhal304r1_c051g0135121 [Plasmopara halstedii]
MHQTKRGHRVVLHVQCCLVGTLYGSTKPILKCGGFCIQCGVQFVIPRGVFDLQDAGAMQLRIR